MIPVRKHVATALGVVALLLLAPNCGGDSGSTGPGSTPDVTGNWTAVATYNNAQLQTTCTFNGSVSIAQSGTTFTGQVTGSVVTCVGPGGTASGNFDGPITGGQISGSTMNYSSGECTYTGTISGSPANRVQGNVSCNVAIGGTTYPFNGTWQISR